jgi:tetratricopeptide (TPR) repeat protein
MWESYSARQAAQLIGLAESAVRACIRDGLVGAPNVVPAQLSFRDLAALRAVKALVDGGLSLPRVRRELVRIQRALPPDASLAELVLEVKGGRVHVRGDDASDGQLALPLEPEAPLPPGELRELPQGQGTPMPAPAPIATADQWLARAQQLEERDPVAAKDAYRRSLRLRPECTEAWIDLGRVCAETDDVATARDCFARALELDPGDATAHYNLGVLAQDDGREDDAIASYRRALELDPALAEAHYNLATLFDRSGDARAAIRHINEYRKLTR